MTKEAEVKEENFHYNKGMIVKISSKVVNSTHVAYATMQCPEFIIFTKNVKKFDMLAFKGVDCFRFNFSTATNLERIGKKCFKNAKNIWWSEVLEKAEQENDSFEDASIINKEAREENEIKKSQYLANDL